jgi:type IV pilus assembly protein PilQ
MKGPRTREKLYWLTLIGFIIFLTIGCASQKTVEPLPTQTSIPRNLVTKIGVEASAEGKKITIEGQATLAYTFFRLIPQPLKLLVDIPQTDLTPEASSPITIGDGIIQEISALQHNGDVEISIGLDRLVRYQVQKEGNILSIFMEKQGPILAKEEEKKEEIQIPSEMPPPVKEEGIAEALPSAKNLVDIFVDTSQKDRIVLQLKADGQLGDYNSFDLQKPTRLVIDLWKIKNQFGKKTLSVNSPYLKKVRFGNYPEKVRVVLDIPSVALPVHRLDRIGNSLVIILGKKEVVAQAVPQELGKEVAEGEEEVSPPLVPISGELTGIDFKQLEDKSRIIIATSAKSTYEVSKGPEDTVLIDVHGMKVPPKLSRPLDTHEFSSPVLMITPLNIAAGAKKGAQVVVKLRKMVAFVATQENEKIFVDFERTEEFMGEKPKPVEVVTATKPPAEQAAELPVEVKKEAAAQPSEQKVTPAAPTPGAEQKIYTGKKITLDFKDADIANILRLFAEVSDLNIIATGDVKGTVTIRLVDVPWDQAFDIVLQANNLGAERIGNVVRVAPVERLNAERKVKAEASKTTEEIEPLASETIPISYGDVKSIGDTVKPILSSRGKVVVDPRTNTIIVTDIRSILEKVKQLVRTLDAQTPQVLIQSKIIEASLNFSRDLGIQWGGSFLGQNASSTMAAVGTADSGTYSTSGTSTGGGWAVDIPAAVASGTGGAMSFVIANLQNTRSLQLRLSALESTGEGRIISSPRVLTLDNKEASIEQGMEIPYPQYTAEGTVSTIMIEALLKLTVTPHVTSDGHIRLELDIKKDAPDTTIEVQGQPAIDKEEVKTEVLVKDGEIVVLGGIYQFTKTGPTVNAVPFLYKIPLLGWMFQERKSNEEKKELLIFIFPTIVQPRRIVTS